MDVRRVMRRVVGRMYGIFGESAKVSCGFVKGESRVMYV